ncbi:PREDICTED: pentatricopeptide repeat-containing protein At3g24000, mitochondrial [Tarenaya hassleriana]|uniref:pentatricopeptide repeat-containing protein At3g24000, mitochondrial n=1 Tax=Tarenaya hassleriana TaxID=28532 RepID=UPI0008FD2457|nr:PREDICTED: pentatricopeptide repeat-containing protein At3g24000, mitochondrial [Tarenaya hassleriana]
MNGRLSTSNHWNPEISCFHQKGFSQITREITGRAVHALCVKGLVRLSVLYTNTLIHMYARFGRIGIARYVFDEMAERNEASWNTMMSGLVVVRFYREGMEFLREMCDLGVKPSGFFISSLVTACDRSGLMFTEGVQVHGFVVKCGFLSDVYVGTAMLHFYGVYGLVSCSRKLFDEMPDRNVASWTSLMVGYKDMDEPDEVMDIYKGMIREGVGCNENSMALVIRSCGLLKGEFLGSQVIGQMMKSGLENKLAVENSLISMFGSFGNIEDARYIFDHMPERDTISWNSIVAAYAQNGICLESLRVFCSMRHFHDEVNSTTLSTLLSALGHVDHLKWGRGIHGMVIKMGFDSVSCVCNTLLDMYSGAGRSAEAELVFQQMPTRDLISWNSLVACYAEDGRNLDALQTLSLMIRTGKTVNYVTFTSALAACSSPEIPGKGRILHGLVMVLGLFNNQIVGNALVSMYAKTGMMREAKWVLLKLPGRDEVAWNALIGGYAENEEPDEALKAFQTMREEAIPSSYITIIAVLGSCLMPNDLLEYGMPLHAYVVSAGFESDEHIQNSLITMYAKCGDLSSSRSIFDGLEYKKTVAWNAMIAANARHGLGEEVLKLIAKMKGIGLNLDQFSFSEGLSAAAKLALLEEGQQLHGLAIKLGFGQDYYIVIATADMYNKCGEIHDVLKMLPPTANQSLPTWNIRISAFARHGLFEEARETFREMLEKGIKPGHITFVSLLSACSHRGLVDEGLAFYDMMTREFGVAPAIEHCVCVIDLLGRSGRLAEAEAFISQMPMKPNNLVWRSLLASCKIHGDLELGRKAAENLLRLEPEDDSVYVLSSNMFATTGRWEEAEKVRRQMGSRKIKKKPACSWVKLKDKVMSFGIGDGTNIQAREENQIEMKLEEIKKMIREAGYVADTSDALQDTDEEQKEHNLWNHSERLALAYALTNAPNGSTLRIFKNLRVCRDCHSVYKFVSRVFGRKILLRDPYRFHHFHGGDCSCNDYW